MDQADTPPHEVLPCADPNDAGTSWRAEKLKDLIWRAKCLGVRDTPEVQALEREMREATVVLDRMAVEQSDPKYERPWWKDGEYDAQRAEKANDEGMVAYAEKKYRLAFESYTEAARLEPKRPGYHANRAAAGLKLGYYARAAADAENALKIDPTHVKAALRAGEAWLRTRRPAKASAHFKNALRLCPGNGVAQRGLAKATAEATLEKITENKITDASRRGSRAALPEFTRWPDLETAAETALSAEEIYESNPRSAFAAVAAAEACVLCGAPKRALEFLDQFDAGDGGETRGGDNLSANAVNADLAYVRAEASWRVGDVAAATAALGAFAEAAARETARREKIGALEETIRAPSKILALGAHLTKLQDLTKRAREASDDGRPDVAFRALTEALKNALAKPLWWRGALGPRNQKRFPYPNVARGELLRKRAEALLDCLDEQVMVEVPRIDADDFEDEPESGSNGLGKSEREKRSADTVVASMFRRAERDLNESLLIAPDDVETRKARVRARRSVGDILGAFDDARAALDVAPGDPALNRLARDLAKEAMGDARGKTPGDSPWSVPENRNEADVPAAYGALNVTRSADARAIRRGYRRAAAMWHPDKWTKASEEEKADAASQFRRVAVAYELLGDQKKRKEYDADPGRFDA